MSKKIAINGFGRIGRLTFRQLFKEGFDIVAINDLTNTETLAYLLEFDSAQGRFESGKISHGEGYIKVAGKKVKVFAERDAANLPWKELGIDLVVESTGFYTSKQKAEAHLHAGAKKVVISAPASGDMKTVVFGVNQNILNNQDRIISAASCTTNSLAPLVKVLNDAFGIKKGLMTTVHAVTNDQKLLDLPHEQMRRGRAAAWNITPASTGAAAAIGLVIPEVAGKMDGLALRVPVIDGSVTDLTLQLSKKVSKEEINNAVKYAIHKDSDLAKALDYNDQQIVSSDIIGTTYGATYDATLTKVFEHDGSQLVKVFSWYDNENSYVSQLVRIIKHFITL